MKKTTVIATGVAVIAALTGCAANEVATDQSTPPPASASHTATRLTGTIDAGGSSAQTAAHEAWRAGFQASQPEVTVNYDPTGSGTGRQNFTDGGYVLAGTDEPLAIDHVAGPFAACAPGSALVEIPAYVSAIAIGFNLDGVASLTLDATLIARIFSGEITRWNDPAIVAANPQVGLPDLGITAIHRSDKSGTTHNFTDYLAQAAGSAWPYPVAQTWPSQLSGEAAEKTQGVRQAIIATPGAIGYLDASQAQGMGSVVVGAGEKAVAHSAQAAAAAVGASPLEQGRSTTDVVVALNRTLTDGQSYPIVLVSYLVACGTYADPDVGQLVKSYLGHVVSEAGQQEAAKHAGSSPITADPTLSGLVAKAVAGIH
ncbi:MAG: phosphate ABC transporter substrate-binding protein PstS [Propionibacteriaceae bacterium]|jgi:phosphate transport system substrate-binding protein|nr:phosphate ABC transporter substrate-binding protein PstS [Propionibacteriaceae bacterium]